MKRIFETLLKKPVGVELERLIGLGKTYPTSLSNVESINTDDEQKAEKRFVEDILCFHGGKLYSILVFSSSAVSELKWRLKR